MGNTVDRATCKRVLWGSASFFLTFLLFFSWEDYTWYGALKAAVGVLIWGVVFQILEWAWKGYRSRCPNDGKRSDSS